MRRARRWLLTAFILGVAPTATAAEVSRSFECAFSEPWDQLVFAQNRLWWSPGNAEPEWTRLATGGVSRRADGGITYNTKAPDGAAFGLEIKRETASWLETDHTVAWNAHLDSRGPDTGGCVRMADNAQPRKVVSAANDPLNVRIAPRASSASVGTLERGTVVWQIPGRSGSWVRVSYADVGAGLDQGPIRVATGWVNNRFLGPL